MLVVASDLHLTDETVGLVVPDKTFTLFASRLRELAYQASWRADRFYDPVREVDILFLGDVIDPLQSTRWFEKQPDQEGFVRPWHDPYSPNFIHKLGEITRAIFEKNEQALHVLKRIANQQVIQLPPTGRNGQPDPYSRERISPVVNIYYMVGNHDWFFHLPGPEYDALRATIIQAMGLSNGPGPFPHGIETAEDKIQELMRRYRIVARHGDQYDPISYNAAHGRNAAALSDIYSLDVLYRFPYEVKRRLQNDLPANLAHKIQRVVNVRPLMAAPLWLFEQILRHDDEKKHIQQVKQIWDEVVSDFLALDVLRSDQFVNHRARNGLKLFFGASKQMSFPALAGMSRMLRNTIADEHISIARFARQEPSIRSGQADFALYGHTHSHEIIPLEPNNGSTGPIYINTGAWASVLDYSQAANRSNEKTRPIHQLNCIAIYREAERLGKRYENWSANFS